MNSKKINVSFYALLLLFIQVIISDTIIYFLKMEYSAAQCVAVILNFTLNFFLIKRKDIKVECDFKKSDIIFLIIFFIFTIATIIYPDEFYDSFSYHIYLQKNAFTDKITYDFFPGRTLTTYTYPIVDRVYFLFSNKLGFRLGTLPGYLVILVMYYQIKKIIRKLLDDNIKEFDLSFLSIFPICSYIILQQVGTYYIDNFCIVLLLEFLYILLFESKNLLKNKINLYFLALICGIAFSVKFTMAFYIIVPLIYIVIINFRDIKLLKWCDYIGIIFVGLIPSGVYMLDAIIDTGSPVFPYYNSIFKSKYFGEYDWFDSEFGIDNIWQAFYWPIYITLYPDEGYQGSLTDGNFLYGYIVSIIYILYFIIHELIIRKYIRKEKTEWNYNLSISLIILYFNFVMAKFCIGYTRYGGIIPVISGIFIIKVLIDLIKRNNMLCVSIVLIMMINSCWIGIRAFSWTLKGCHYLVENWNYLGKEIKLNFSYVLKDQDCLKYDIDGIWGVIGDESALPSMLRVDDRIVQLRRDEFSGDNTPECAEIYWDNVLNNDIYVPIHDLTKYRQVAGLNSNKFEIIEIENILYNVPYLSNAGKIVIVKVKYNENFEEDNFEILKKLESKCNKVSN